MGNEYTNKELQQLFVGDQQGYLYADLCRIIANGCDEKITDDHIAALRAQNIACMAVRGDQEEVLF